MQSNDEFLAGYTPQLDRNFYHFIQTDTALRLLYNVNPNGAKVVYLKQCQATRLESFRRFAVRNELKPENIKTVKSIEDVHRAVDAIKKNIRGTCRSTQHMVLLAHRLLHSCKVCQRFIRKSLIRLREQKAILLKIWIGVEETARKNLSVELSRRASMIHAAQAQDTIRDMWSLYLDCFASVSRMQDAIDCCWKERRDVFVGRLRRWRDEQREDIEEDGSGGQSSIWARSSRLRAAMLTFPQMKFKASQVTYTELCAHLQLLLIRSAVSAISLETAEGRAMVTQMPSFVGALDTLPNCVSYYHALTTMEPRRNLTKLMILKEFAFDVKLKLPPAGPSFTREQYKKAGEIAAQWHLVPVYRDGLRKAASGSNTAVSAAAVREAVYKHGMSEDAAVRKAVRDRARSETNSFLDDAHSAREMLQLRRLSSPLAYRRSTYEEGMAVQSVNQPERLRATSEQQRPCPLPASPRGRHVSFGTAEATTTLQHQTSTPQPASLSTRRARGSGSGGGSDLCGMREWDAAYGRSLELAGVPPTGHSPSSTTTPSPRSKHSNPSKQQQQQQHSTPLDARDVKSADSCAAVRFAKMLSGQRPVSAGVSRTYQRPGSRAVFRPQSASPTPKYVKDAIREQERYELRHQPSPPPPPTSSSSAASQHPSQPISLEEFVVSRLDSWLFGAHGKESVVRGGGGVLCHADEDADNDAAALPAAHTTTATTATTTTSTTAPCNNLAVAKVAVGCGRGGGGVSPSQHHRGVASPDASESDAWGDANTSRPESGLGLSASTPYHLGGSRPQSAGGISLAEGRMLTCNSIRIGQGRPPPPSSSTPSSPHLGPSSPAASTASAVVAPFFPPTPPHHQQKPRPRSAASARPNSRVDSLSRTRQQLLHSISRK